MAASVAKPVGKGLSGMFSGKVGGVPKSVLFLVLAVALYFVIGKFLKNKSTTSTAAGTNSVPTAPDNVGYPQPQDSTGGGAAGQPMMDMTGLTDALNNQLQQMQVPAGDTYNYYYTGDPASVGQGGGNVSPAASLQNVATPASSNANNPVGPVYEYPTPASTPNFAIAAAAKTAAANLAQAPVAFGGVTGTKTLANGSTITTYGSGRQVQQAPGKSAYVVKK